MRHPFDLGVDQPHLGTFEQALEKLTGVRLVIDRSVGVEVDHGAHAEPWRHLPDDDPTRSSVVRSLVQQRPADPVVAVGVLPEPAAVVVRPRGRPLG
jgi:hypothetical protein